jgi:hypothetical protein
MMTSGAVPLPAGAYAVVTGLTSKTHAQTFNGRIVVVVEPSQTPHADDRVGVMLAHNPTQVPAVRIRNSCLNHISGDEERARALVDLLANPHDARMYYEEVGASRATGNTEVAPAKIVFRVGSKGSDAVDGYPLCIPVARVDVQSKTWHDTMTERLHGFLTALQERGTEGRVTFHHPDGILVVQLKTDHANALTAPWMNCYTRSYEQFVAALGVKAVPVYRKTTKRVCVTGIDNALEASGEVPGSEFEAQPLTSAGKVLTAEAPKGGLSPLRPPARSFRRPRKPEAEPAAETEAETEAVAPPTVQQSLDAMTALTLTVADLIAEANAGAERDALVPPLFAEADEELLDIMRVSMLWAIDGLDRPSRLEDLVDLSPEQKAKLSHYWSVQTGSGATPNGDLELDKALWTAVNKFYERQYDAQHGGTGAIGAAAAEEKRLVAQMPDTVDRIVCSAAHAAGDWDHLIAQVTEGTAGACAPVPQGAQAPKSPYAPHLAAHADLAMPYGEAFNVKPLPHASTKAKAEVLPKGSGFSDVPLLPRTSDGSLVLPDGRRVQAGEELDDCGDVDELEHARLAVHAMLGANSEMDACDKLQKMGIAGTPVAPPKLQRLVRGRERGEVARRAQVA